MILRFLNWQGIAGIAASLGLAVLLLIQKGETRHWMKQSASLEQLYHQEQAAFSTTVTNYRAAASQAKAADKANAQRVVTEQQTINERTKNEFETRLASARADARRLRDQAANAAADPGARGNAPVPGLPVAAGGAAQGSGEDGLSQSDRLTATEQAIQLDELIKWVRQQHQVEPNDSH